MIEQIIETLGAISLFVIVALIAVLIAEVEGPPLF